MHGVYHQPTILHPSAAATVPNCPLYTRPSGRCPTEEHELSPNPAVDAGGRRRVAVIGSGVAGLTAAYVLNRQDNVTLFEADSRLGGDAHTHGMPQPDGSVIGVDTGFIVHNERTYPTLLRLFAELGVETQDSEMSMSIRCDGCGTCVELVLHPGTGRSLIFPMHVRPPFPALPLQPPTREP